VFLEALAGTQRRGYSVLSVDVTLGETFSHGPVGKLFEVPWYAGSGQKRAYDVTSDAGRFVFVQEEYPPPVAELDRIHLILNWQADLLERVRSD
jgi:hypothetical protein